MQNFVDFRGGIAPCAYIANLSKIDYKRVENDIPNTTNLRLRDG